MKFEFLTDLKKKSNIKVNEHSPKGAELFHTDRRMDKRKNMTKLKVDFRNTANAPKTSPFI